MTFSRREKKDTIFSIFPFEVIHTLQPCSTENIHQLKEMGFSQDALDKLPGWKHSKAFDHLQQLVLSWAEAVTLMRDDLQPIREMLEKQFTQKELVELTASISLMNALNRLRITLGEKD